MGRLALLGTPTSHHHHPAAASAATHRTDRSHLAKRQKKNKLEFMKVSQYNPLYFVFVLKGKSFQQEIESKIFQ